MLSRVGLGKDWNVFEIFRKVEVSRRGFLRICIYLILYSFFCYKVVLKMIF